MKRFLDVAIAAGLALVVWALYHKVLRLWWTFDDAYLLHVAIVRRVAESFDNPSVWTSMPQRLFTPLLTTTYDAALSAFGFDAGRFFALHLVLAAAAVIAVYAALRCWLECPFAACGALLFAAGVPVINVVTELMLIHYLEAVLLAALAVIAYARGHDVLAALLYLAAMLAKEIAVPLILILPLLPGSRARRVIPHAVALVVYLAWRYAMLGTLGGGYGWSITPRDIPMLLVKTPLRALALFAGPHPGFGWVVVAVLFLGIALPLILGVRWRSHRFCNADEKRWLRHRTPKIGRYALAVVVALAAALGPVLPVAKKLEPRFTLATWLALSVLFAVGTAMLRRPAALALITIAPLLAIAVNRQAWPAEINAARRQSDEARVFFDLGPGTLLRAPTVPPAALGELRWLKEDWQHRPPGAAWFYDDLFVCTGGAAGKRVFEYRGRGVVEIALPLDACGKIRHNAPLVAELHHRGETLFWHFGPYHDGRWAVVVANGVQSYDVPAEDGFRLAGVPGMTFRVKYVSPEGWVTYSPELAMDFARQPDLVFRR